jgi:hypothetical protein
MVVVTNEYENANYTATKELRITLIEIPVFNVCEYTVNIQYIHLKNNDISVDAAITQCLIIIMSYQFS